MIEATTYCASRYLQRENCAFGFFEILAPRQLWAGGLVARGVAGGQRQGRGRQMWRVISAVSSKAGGRGDYEA